MKKICTSFMVVVACILSYSQSCLPDISVNEIHSQDAIIPISCDNPLNDENCLELEVEYTELKSTSDYMVSSIPYSPVAGFNEGNRLNLYEEDKFSNAIPLPFKFCFYGETYEELVIGNNGLVSFDTSLANEDCPWYISGSIPDENLVRNAIFGSFHDMSNVSLTCDDDPSTPYNDCGEIYTKTIGVAPCRIFVINFHNMTLFNCKDKKSTFQIALHESTNDIEVYIESKPESCEGAKEKRALVGIQDKMGNKGVFPQGRNTSSWEASNEAWKFKPNGDMQVSFKWTDKNGKVVSTKQNPVLCELEDNYKINLETTFYTCSNNNVIINREYTIKFSEDYPLARNINHELCDVNKDGVESFLLNSLDSTILEGKTGFVISYYNAEGDAENKLNPITNPIIATSTNKTFYYRMESREDCFAVYKANVKLAPNPQNQLKSPYLVCDVGNNGIENIDLLTLNPIIAGNQNSLTIEFYKTQADAEGSISSITNFNVQSNSSVFVKISRDGGCSTIDEIKFELVSTPQSVNIQGETLCYMPNAPINIRHDFTKYENQIPDFKNSSFVYYLTKEDAQNDTQRVENPKSINITSNPFMVYIRTYNSTTKCYSISTIKINLNESFETIDEKLNACDVDGDEVETFNLTTAISSMIPSTANKEVSYYQNYYDALNNNINKKIATANTLAYTAKDKTYIYVRFQDTISGCVSIAKIILNVFPIPEPSSKVITICVDDITSSQSIDLESYSLVLTKHGEYVDALWFKNESDAVANTNSLSSYLAKDGDTIWVRLFSTETDCWEVYPIEIEFLQKGEVVNLNPYTIQYCNQLNDNEEYIDLTSYSSDMFRNYAVTNVVFYKKYENGQLLSPIANPSTYNVVGSDVIYAEGVKNICASSVQVINLIQNEVVDFKNARVEFCDEHNQGKINVNINSYLSEMSSDYKNYKVTLFKTYESAIDNNSADIVSNPTNYEIKTGNNDVYVRMENTIGCFNVKYIRFELKNYPKEVDLVKICDNENDLVENDFMLSSVNNQISSGIGGVNVKYYESLSDAESNSNAIQNYTITSTTKLFVKASNGICSTISEISFEFIPASVIKKEFVDKICDNNNDGFEIVDLTLYNSNFVNDVTLYTFEYFPTETDAINNTNKITKPTEHKVTDTDYVRYIRVYNSNKCYSIAKLSVVLDRKILAIDAELQYVCDVYSNTTAYVDLESYIPKMIDDTTGLDIAFYKYYEEAMANKLESKIQNTTNYKLDAISNVIYVRFFNPELGCYSIKKIPIRLQLPPKLVVSEYFICDTDFNGFYDLELDELNSLVIKNHQDYNFTYYLSQSDAINKTNLINASKRYETNVPINIYINVDNGVCEETTFVTLKPNVVTPIKSIHIFYTDCEEDDNHFTLNLNQFKSQFVDDISNTVFRYYTSRTDADKEINPISNPNQFWVTNQTIYVRITSGGLCPVIGEIEVKVKRKPVIPMESKVEFCVGTSVEIDAGLNLPKENYVWNHGKIGKNIVESIPGIYTVNVTGENGCVASKSIELVHIEAPVIEQLVVTGNNVQVIASDGQNEVALVAYSVNQGHTWESANVFSDLSPGKHTFIVKNLITGCISLPKSTIVIDIKNFISPSTTDNKNDIWTLENLDVFEGKKSSIIIFDRYGKVVYSDESSSRFVWDGHFAGRPLPSTTYWYKIELADGRKIDGFIVVKNR
ncbi:MAG: T9SS type B sorting domain-containing protein [Flavobacteriales bacterium]|nr:T9SS type B sorting domain-containing protein [Flavobacteriales bacterium]